MLRKLGIGFIALATMAPGLAAALGVGEYELNSYLNEPLDMTVELHDLGGLSEDEILANLATQEAFDDFVPSDGNTREKPPKQPQTMAQWARCADNFA